MSLSRAVVCDICGGFANPAYQYVKLTEDGGWLLKAITPTANPYADEVKATGDFCKGCYDSLCHLVETRRNAQWQQTKNSVNQ
jgi:hypothetical protein